MIKFENRINKLLADVLTFLILATAITPLSNFTRTDIEINETNFPDTNFRTYISENFDQDNDGTLSLEEGEVVTEIIVSNKGITSLKGLEYFPNLQKLEANNNNLVDINLEHNKHLDITQLNLSENLFTIAIPQNRQFDLSNLESNFDTNKTSNWVGGNLSGTTLTVDENVTEVSYDYETNNPEIPTINFRLIVEENDKSDTPSNSPDSLNNDSSVTRQRGDAFVENTTKNITYDNLTDAIEGADPGNELKLLKNLAIQDKILIPAEKNLTIDLNEKTITSRISEKYSYLFNVTTDTKGGSLSIKNGKMTASDPNSEGYTGGAIRVGAKKTVNLKIDNLEISDFKVHVKGAALSIYANQENGAHQVQVTNCHFHDNKSDDNGGGAISYETYVLGAELTIDKCVIENNFVDGDSRVDGGGVFYDGPGSFTMTNSIVQNNRVQSSYDFYGFRYAQGGGLSIVGPLNKPGNLKVYLKNNLVKANQAQIYGGGIYFELSEYRGDQLELVSGIFEDNYSAYAGGAIDYSAHNQPPLQLKNVMITGNKAITGAGIWLCPDGSLKSYSSLGGFIVNNALSNKHHPYSSGTDIRFEGSNSSYIPSSGSNTTVTVSPRDFTGELIYWYADEMGNLYKPGDHFQNVDYYTDRKTTFGLLGKSEAGAEHLKEIEDKANIIIRNNTAAFRGGGISSNSPIIIGDPETKETELTVVKIWKDELGNELNDNLPNSIKVTLIRIDSQNTETDLETIELTADNNWSHTFKNLPVNGIIDNKQVTFTYDVREETQLDGFELIKETTAEKQEVILINKSKPSQPTESTKPSEPTKTTVVTETTETTTPTESTKPGIETTPRRSTEISRPTERIVTTKPSTTVKITTVKEPAIPKTGEHNLCLLSGLLLLISSALAICIKKLS